MPVPLTLNLTYTQGVSPDKWFKRWRERHPGIALNTALLPFSGAHSDGDAHVLPALVAKETHLAFLRLPHSEAELAQWKDQGLAVIPLYQESSVVVAALEHYLAAADELTLAELIDEPLAENALSDHPLGPFDVAAQMELAATGAMVAVLPQSLARMNARKDTVQIPLLDAPPLPVGLVFTQAAEHTEMEMAIEEFVGVVRGRSETSSRQPKVKIAQEQRAKAAGKKSSSETKRQSQGTGQPKKSPRTRLRRGGRGRG